MGQIEVLVTQFGEIPLIERFLLVVLRYCLQFQQSSLPHEDSLYLEKVVTMMRHCSQRQVLCPLFKGIVIDAKAVVTGQRHEIGILPRTTTLLHPMADGLSLLF